LGQAAQGSGGVPIPGGVQTPPGCGPWGRGLAGMGVSGWRLDLVTSGVFPNLSDSMNCFLILEQRGENLKTPYFGAKREIFKQHHSILNTGFVCQVFSPQTLSTFSAVTDSGGKTFPKERFFGGENISPNSSWPSPRQSRRASTSSPLCWRRGQRVRCVRDRRWKPSRTTRPRRRAGSANTVQRFCQAEQQLGNVRSAAVSAPGALNRAARLH